MARLTRTGAGIRFFFALLLVSATYNPSGFSYFHWVVDIFPNITAVSPYIAIAGVILLIGWVIYLRATLRSLGAIGITLVLLASASLLWLMFDWGWLNVDSKRTLVWVVQTFIALGLAVGMCWSHIRLYLSGQVDSDDVGGSHD